MQNLEISHTVLMVFYSIGKFSKSFLFSPENGVREELCSRFCLQCWKNTGTWLFLEAVLHFDKSGISAFNSIWLFVLLGRFVQVHKWHASTWLIEYVALAVSNWTKIYLLIKIKSFVEINPGSWAYPTSTLTPPYQRDKHTTVFIFDWRKRKIWGIA